MRSLSLVLCAVCSLGVLSGCQKKNPSEQKSGAQATPSSGVTASTPAPVTDENTILLGEVGSLTGAQATFGISTKNGIEMALDEVNQAGGINGKKLAVRVYDDQGKQDEAANATTRLINQDHVRLILGEVASTNSLAMADKAQPAGVPMITPASTNAKVTQGRDYVFRVCFIDPFQGYVMAKFAREDLKLANVAVLKDQKSDYSLGLSDVFIRKFTEMGGKIVGQEAYSQGDSDFRAQLLAIKKTSPEAVYVPGYYNDVGLIARQAREVGLKVPLLGGDGWDSEKLFELGGSAVVGSYFSNHYSPDDPAPYTQQFIANYKKRFGEVPDALAALGYDAAKVAADAFKRAGADASGAALRDAIAKTAKFPGVTGVITMDEHRNAVKPAVVLKVGDKKKTYAATIQP